MINLTTEAGVWQHFVATPNDGYLCCLDYAPVWVFKITEVQTGEVIIFRPILEDNSKRWTEFRILLGNDTPEFGQFIQEKNSTWNYEIWSTESGSLDPAEWDFKAEVGFMQFHNIVQNEPAAFGSQGYIIPTYNG